MHPAPELDRFVSLAAGADRVPVWVELPFDTDTAVTAYHKLARPPFSFLLESVVGGERWARYTFLGTEPRRAWRLRGGRISLWNPGTGWGREEGCDDPLADLDRRLRSVRPAQLPELPRFWGGWVGFFGYDTVRHLEHLPDAPPDPVGLPDALFMDADLVVAIDNLVGRARVIATVGTEDGDAGALPARYREAVARIEGVVDRLRSGPGPAPLLLGPPPASDPAFRSSMSRERFEAGVRRIQEYVLAGDVFQVVLSQRLTVEPESEPFSVYRALRTLNPSPYLYYLELDGMQLVGSSPEVLVRVEDGTVTVRPIAGTRPRGRDGREDERLAAELRADPKELSEHLMLLDLGRNDVGRVAEHGTVRVPERMVIERYSHVLHLVSSVEGRLAAGRTALDALRAAFPAGTVSGAPKVRAMEIIDELEPVRRGPYAGAVGYLAHGGGAMDTAIAIRTVVMEGGRAHVQAGAGVVADSVPASEYDETLAKARGLLRAIQRSAAGAPGVPS